MSEGPTTGLRRETSKQRASIGREPQSPRSPRGSLRGCRCLNVRCTACS